MSYQQGSTGPARTPSASAGQRQTPLFRGAGCHHCRTRKVKCDAGKPYCGRCMAHGTTEFCKYDEVKKSKLTLIKEENAELKERVALLERQLAGVDPATSFSNGKEPAQETKDLPPLSRLRIEPELDFKQELELEDEVEELYELGGSGSYDAGTGDYPVQAQQHSAESYPAASNQSHSRSGLYSQPQQHAAQSGHYLTTPRQYPSPSGQPQAGYGSYQAPAGSYYTQPGHSPVDPFRAAGLVPTERPHVPFDAQLGSETLSHPSWSAVRNDSVPTSATGTSSYTPSPSGGSWQQLPCLSPEDTPASPGGTSYPTSSSYIQGVTFDDYGAYQGGAMPSYDAYQGAPNLQAALVTRRRPMRPSPPVFGHDMIMTFFQKWRSDHQAQAYIEDEYAAQAAYDNSNRALVGNWWERDDLSISARDHLLGIFLPYRKQVGLEIWVPDFLASLHNPPKGRPHPGLMWMIYTFAAFFSNDPDLQALVPQFMERARRNLEESYARSDRLFNYIQGQTLYSSILYMTGRISEGYLASSMACNVAILCGLHKISSPILTIPAQSKERSALRIRQIDFQLEPATSLREHGERIAAFWQLVLVDHSAAATTGLPAMFRDDGDERSRVETVLPRPIEEYINMKAAELPYATLGDIFAPKFVPDPPDTVMALQVKSTALLERTVRLATSWSNGKHASTTNPDKYMAEYHNIMGAIRHFRSYMPPLLPVTSEDSQLPKTSKGLIWERLYPYYITLNAQIQLYNVLEAVEPLAYDSCLKSARDFKAMIEQLADDEISLLGVMLGHAFTSASHVFLRELKRCRERQDEMGVEIVNQELDVIHHGLAILGQHHHLASVQSSRADKVRLEENSL